MLGNLGNQVGGFTDAVGGLTQLADRRTNTIYAGYQLFNRNQRFGAPVAAHTRKTIGLLGFTGVTGHRLGHFLD